MANAPPNFAIDVNRLVKALHCQIDTVSNTVGRTFFTPILNGNNCWLDFMITDQRLRTSAKGSKITKCAYLVKASTLSFSFQSEIRRISPHRINLQPKIF